MAQTPVRVESLQSCLTFCDTMDCSPTGSSVHGILQARIPEWVAMPSSRGIFLTPAIKPAPLTFQAFANGLFTTSTGPETPRIKQNAVKCAMSLEDTGDVSCDL